MRSNTFCALSHIAQLNSFKKDTLNRTITEKEIRMALRDCGIPCNINFWTTFKKNFLKKVNVGVYIWDTLEPIHHRKLQEIYRAYQDNINARYRKSKEARHKQEENIKVAQAIDLLKALGYKIYKEI